MKTNYIYAVLLSLLFSTFWGCSDWTETESEDYLNIPERTTMPTCVTISRLTIR